MTQNPAAMWFSESPSLAVRGVNHGNKGTTAECEPKQGLPCDRVKVFECRLFVGTAGGTVGNYTSPCYSGWGFLFNIL